MGACVSFLVTLNGNVKRVDHRCVGIKHQVVKHPLTLPFFIPVIVSCDGPSSVTSASPTSVLAKCFVLFFIAKAIGFF